jgi:hypothetical protein
MQQTSRRARARSAWLVALPLAVAGSLLAHQLAYLIVAGDHASAVLAETGHGYLDQLPMLGALGGTTLMLGLGLAGFDRLRGVPGQAVPTWAVGLLPLISFALQEHLERFAHTGQVPWTTALDATFLVGLALQVPFAAIAFVVSRALLSTVAAVVATLLARPEPPSRCRTIIHRVVLGPRGSAAGLSRSRAPRGPPEFLPA